MTDDREQAIIIVKKITGGHGHHGGSWKVAFADFMTAMMAFFLVLWLVGQDQKIKEAVAGYFTDPVGFHKGGKLIEGKGPGPMKGEKPSVDAKRAAEIVKQHLEAAAKRISDNLQKSETFQALKDNVQIEVTPEGLRIQLIEGADSALFESGSARMSPTGQAILTLIAEEVQKLPNRIVYEGHTDAAGGANQFGYSNWDLGADRANYCRKILTRAGVGVERVKEVRSYAATQPAITDNPLDPRNRRISILILNDIDYLLENNMIDSANGGRLLDPAAYAGAQGSPQDEAARRKAEEIPAVDEGSFKVPDYLQEDAKTP